MTIRRMADTNLFVGNSNDARDIDTMRKLGIKAAVNVAKDLEAPWFHGGFRNYKIGLNDGPGNQVYQYVLAATVVKRLLDEGEKVLLHCHAGASRSPVIAALVLTWMGRCPTLDEAHAFVIQHRKSVNIVGDHWPMVRLALKELQG